MVPRSLARRSPGGLGRGTRLLAGEEADGTLEVLVVTPVSRTRSLLEKAAALGVAVVALGAVLWVGLVVTAADADTGVSVRAATMGTLSMVRVGLLHGWLALALGAAIGFLWLALGAVVLLAVNIPWFTP